MLFTFISLLIKDDDAHAENDSVSDLLESNCPCSLQACPQPLTPRNSRRGRMKRISRKSRTWWHGWCTTYAATKARSNIVSCLRPGATSVKADRSVFGIHCRRWYSPGYISCGSSQEQGARKKRVRGFYPSHPSVHR